MYSIPVICSRGMCGDRSHSSGTWHFNEIESSCRHEQNPRSPEKIMAIDPKGGTWRKEKPFGVLALGDMRGCVCFVCSKKSSKPEENKSDSPICL
jgi:hypothetical protein